MSRAEYRRKQQLRSRCRRTNSIRTPSRRLHACSGARMRATGRLILRTRTKITGSFISSTGKEKSSESDKSRAIITIRPEGQGETWPRHRLVPILSEIFELLRLNFAAKNFLTTNGHQWTRIDPSNSCSFVFIRGFFLIVCGCGYAALWSSVNDSFGTRTCHRTWNVAESKVSKGSRSIFGKLLFRTRSAPSLHRSQILRDL